LDKDRKLVNAPSLIPPYKIETRTIRGSQEEFDNSLAKLIAKLQVETSEKYPEIKVLPVAVVAHIGRLDSEGKLVPRVGIWRLGYGKAGTNPAEELSKRLGFPVIVVQASLYDFFCELIKKIKDFSKGEKIGYLDLGSSLGGGFIKKVSDKPSLEDIEVEDSHISDLLVPGFKDELEFFISIGKEECLIKVPGKRGNWAGYLLGGKAIRRIACAIDRKLLKEGKEPVFLPLAVDNYDSLTQEEKLHLVDHKNIYSPVNAKLINKMFASLDSKYLNALPVADWIADFEGKVMGKIVESIYLGNVQKGREETRWSDADRKAVRGTRNFIVGGTVGTKGKLSEKIINGAKEYLSSRIPGVTFNFYPVKEESEESPALDSTLFIPDEFLQKATQETFSPHLIVIEKLEKKESLISPELREKIVHQYNEWVSQNPGFIGLETRADKLYEIFNSNMQGSRGSPRRGPRISPDLAAVWFELCSELLFKEANPYLPDALSQLSSLKKQDVNFEINKEVLDEIVETYRFDNEDRHNLILITSFIQPLSSQTTLGSQVWNLFINFTKFLNEWKTVIGLVSLAYAHYQGFTEFLTGYISFLIEFLESSLSFLLGVSDRILLTTAATIFVFKVIRRIEHKLLPLLKWGLKNLVKESIEETYGEYIDPQKLEEASAKLSYINPRKFFKLFKEVYSSYHLLSGFRKTLVPAKAEMKTYISIIHLLPFIGQFRDVSHEMLRYAGYYDKKSYIFGLERRDITGKLKYRWLNNAVTDWLAERAFRKSRFWTMMARISFSATLIPDYNYRQQQRILKELFIGLNPEFGEKETEDLIKNAFFKGKEVDAQGKEVDYLDNLIANIDEAFGPGTFAELDLMMERKQFRQAQVLLWEKNYSRIINGYSEDAQQVIQEKLGQEQLEKILDDLEAIIIKNNRKMRIPALSRQIDTSLRTLKEMLSVHLRAEDIASQKAKERIDKLISKNGFEKKQKERGYLPRLSLFKSLLVLMAMGSPLPTQEKKTEIEDLEGEARFLALPSYVKKKIDKAFRALSIELEKLRRNVNEKRNLLQRRMLSFAFLDITEVNSNTRENSNKNPKNSKSNKNLIRHLAPLFLYSSIIQPKNIKPADIIIAKRDKDRVNVLRTMTASASEAIKSIWPTLYRTFARLCLFWVVAFRAIFSPSQRILAGNKLFVNENLGNAVVLMAMGSPLLKNEAKDEDIFLVFPFSFGMLGNIADKIKTWWSDRPFEKSVKAGKIVDSFARITNEQVLPTQETTNEPFAHFSSRALDDNEKFERLDRVQQRLKESLKEPLFLKAYYSPPAGYINHPATNNKSRITVKDDFSALLNFAKKSLTNAATIKSLTISSIILLTISLLLLEKSPSNVPLLISVFIFVIAISKSPEYKLPQVKTSVKEGLGKALLVLMAMGSPLPKTASGEKAILQRLRENLDNPAHLISLLKELSLITERKPPKLLNIFY